MDQYVTFVNNIYINKNIPLLKVPLVLFKCKPLMPRNPFKRIKVIFNYLLIYLSKDSKDFSLPVIGEIAIKVGDTNYKVIRLKEKVIYTIFNENNEKKVYEKLRYSNSSLMYEKILNVDKNNRVIKGVFYNGHNPNLLRTNIKLKRQINNLFIYLLIKSDIKEVNAKSYAITLFQDCLEMLDKNSSKITKEHLDYVKGFLKKRYETFVRSISEEMIPLTLSHGDIKQDNLIEYKNKFLLIDWEFCDFRSPTYDIFKFRSRFPIFEQDFYKNLFKEVKENLQPEEVENRVLNNYFKQFNATYLNLFYLEDIKLRLLQFETRDFASDFTNHLIKTIKRIEEDMEIKRTIYDYELSNSKRIC